jgi:ribonuclease G
VQMNPRVSTQFTGHGARVLHALEAQTGKSFLFEGSEGLELDHFAITFMGTREEVEERALPFRQGDEVLVEIVEPHMYDVDDAVAKIDGYIISIAGAAAYVGEKRMVRIDQVGRTAASALLLDESGEVVAAPERNSDAPAEGRSRGKRRPSSTRRAAASSEISVADESAPEQAAPATQESADGAVKGEGEGDDLQSKPRRRGRRGGRRRSAAKARATTE